MADSYNRRRDPCTTYKREGRTKQNVYQCLPTGTVEYTTNCSGGNAGRTANDIYECCPPTPVELRCSVCWTAERDSCNIWTCVPFVSYSVLCGPTFADIIVYLLNLMPLTFLACLGVAHPRCCSAKPPCPPKSCKPVCTPPPAPPPKCTPVNRCAPCAPPYTPPCAPEKRETKKCGPCNSRKNDNRYMGFEGGDAIGYGKDDNVKAWMHDEYESLARELAEIKRLTNDDEPGRENSDKDMLQARNYVLDRLAEMLAKREEIEKRRVANNLFLDSSFNSLQGQGGRLKLHPRHTHTLGFGPG